MPDEQHTPIFSGKTYDRLKITTQVILPGLASLYFGLSQIWGLPAGEEVVGTIALITVFLGSLIGISANRYNKSDAQYDGVIVPQVDGGGIRAYSMELKDDPENLQYKDKVSFKVQNVNVD